VVQRRLWGEGVVYQVALVHEVQSGWQVVVVSLTWVGVGVT
jgi:hypothetical protein